MSRKPTNSSSYDVFETTITRLEQTLSVGQIATLDVTTCDAEADTRQIWDQYPTYDQVPVRREGKIVGVLERDRSGGPTAAEAMRPLDVDMLVAAEEPISRFIPCLLEEPYYRLVLQGQHLNGIVTRSDLLKLPVRLLAFARVTHLELILANLITAQYPDDTWIPLLSDKQQETIEYHHSRLSESRIDLPRIEVSSLDHKSTVASNLPGLADSFAEDMREIKELRDDLAHSKDFIADEVAFQRFLRRLERADYWITELSFLLAKA